jgi:hypothetical protein
MKKRVGGLKSLLNWPHTLTIRDGALWFPFWQSCWLFSFFRRFCVSVWPVSFTLTFKILPNINTVLMRFLSSGSQYGYSWSNSDSPTKPRVTSRTIYLYFSQHTTCFGFKSPLLGYSYKNIKGRPYANISCIQYFVL